MGTSKKLWKWLGALLALLGTVALGGLFASKATTGYAVLSYVPSVVHPIVGWAIIIGAIGAFAFNVYKAVK